MLIWGMSFVWTSIVFKYLQPFTTVFVRLILSSLFLLIFMLITRRSLNIQKKHFPVFLLSAGLNPFLYFIGESYGLKLTSSTISAVVIATIPLFTPIMTYFAIRERITWLNFAGMILSFTGILIMLLGKGFELVISPLGVGLLMFAVVSAVFYSVFLKKLTVYYSSFQIITIQNMIGAVYFLPLVLLFEPGNLCCVTITHELITALLCLSFFASSLAYILYTQATKEVGVNKTNFLTNLIPVFTGIFSFIIIGEEFTLLKIVGMIIVISGVVLSELKMLMKERAE